MKPFESALAPRTRTSLSLTFVAVVSFLSTIALVIVASLITQDKPFVVAPVYDSSVYSSPPYRSVVDFYEKTPEITAFSMW
jgi:hypothetical protein